MNEKNSRQIIAVPFYGADKEKIRVKGFSQKSAG
jgi:hypothetical protein